MQTLTEIRQLLAERGLRPKHRLGQNFLHDKNQLVKLLDAADVRGGDVILEVGPGTGTLTSALLERGAEVIACELDADMAGIIEEVFAAGEGTKARRHEGTTDDASRNLHGSLTLIKGDALEKDRRLNQQIVRAIADRPFKLVANLPYQIASPLMTTLLIDHSPDGGDDAKPQAAGCTGQFVTIQKEVADRLLAKPSTKEYGPLSIIVQAFAEVKKIGTLGPSCFWPPPEVISAMVAILPSSPPPLGEGSGVRAYTDAEHSFKAPSPQLSLKGRGSDHRREFARFVVELFSKRRKQLGTIIGRDPRLDWPADITPDQRPEALEVEQIIALWQLKKGQ